MLAAVACVERLRAEGSPLPFAVDVLGFSDEEGLRYGTAYLGSRAVAGSFDPALLDLVDDDGIALGAALRAFGGAPQDIASARGRASGCWATASSTSSRGPCSRVATRPSGWSARSPGPRGPSSSSTGRAGHAGTVPMDARHDAACAAAEWVLAVEAAARREPGLVATVGRLEARPGAPNVVPGAAVASLDVRHADDAVRDAAVAALRAEAQRIGAARGVEVAWREVMSAPAVAVDARAQRAAGRGGGRAGLPVIDAGQRRRPRRRWRSRR